MTDARYWRPTCTVQSVSTNGCKESLSLRTNSANSHFGCLWGNESGSCCKSNQRSIGCGLTQSLKGELTPGEVACCLVKGHGLQELDAKEWVGQPVQGFKNSRILWMWMGLMLITGFVAAIGNLVFQNAPPFFAGVHTFHGCVDVDVDS
jgi:hypothetical protein